MISVTAATDAIRPLWDEYVASHPDAEGYHEYAWRAVFEDVVRGKCTYLYARSEDNRIVGVLPLVQQKSRIFGNFLVSVPWFNYCGVLADNQSVVDALLIEASATARSLGARHIELRHRESVALDLPCREDKVSMRLELPKSSDLLWDAFKPKLRSQIRRPQKEGAECVSGGLELLDDFYSVFSTNMRDLGTPVFPKSLFRRMCDSFPESTRIFVVYMNGASCAAGITYGFRNTLEIPSASALRAFNRYSVNMLLYWTVLEYAIEAGYEIFDFGRSSESSGTYRFKAQWGAKPQPLRWHYWMQSGSSLPAINPNNPKYRAATRIWQKLPLPVANVLGPQIVRYIP